MNDPLDRQLQAVYERFGRDHDRLRAQLLAGLPEAAPRQERVGRRRFVRALLGEKRWGKLVRLASAAAAAALIAIVVLWSAVAVKPRLALGDVLEKLAKVRTVHLEITKNGRTLEIWAKRPNRLRIEHPDGTYEISDGPVLWRVNEQANTATKSPSPYYRRAGEPGGDLFDLDQLAESPLADELSGFLSEKPAERVRSEGRQFDVYRVTSVHAGRQVHSEALVDTETQFLHSLRVEMLRDGRKQTFSITVVSHDEPIPDKLFVFTPRKGMTVTARPVRPVGPPKVTGAGKSSLSGRIVWAGSGKPVGGARVTLMGEHVPQPHGGWGPKYFTYVSSDRDGHWEATGAPAGKIRIHVRSWELNWPAMPTFPGNNGSYQDPVILIDGRRDYRDLNFEVHKPEQLYAHITINATDEDGKCVEGAGAFLDSGGGLASIYAARPQQRSGPDGKFDASNVWPTMGEVRLAIGVSDPNSPYVRRFVRSRPFRIEPMKHYHFDMALPFARQMTVRVLDVAGQPLEGVSVEALEAEYGTPIRWTASPRTKPALTGPDGRATLTGLRPGEEVTAALKRLKRDDSSADKVAACQLLPLTAGRDRKPALRDVTFDDRPVRLEGKVELRPGQKLGSVYCGAGRGDPGSANPLLFARLLPSGSFVFETFPAGDVRLLYRFSTVDKQSQIGESRIRTKPGTSYVVTITDAGVEVTREQPWQPGR